MNTPETDSRVFTQHLNWRGNKLKREFVDAKVSRKIEQERDRYRKALERLRDCDWTITLPDRMDAVRAIAREALEE